MFHKARLISGLLVVLSVSQTVSGNELVLTAASEGDAARLKILIENGADVNEARADGFSALAQAIFYGNNPEAVDILISSGANVNTADDYGVTPLHLACMNQDLTSITKLLVAGADPNKARQTGETPLMSCANLGVTEGVKALIKHGADLEAKENREDQTALMWAAAEGHAEVVKVLVANSADVHARSRMVPAPKPHIVAMPESLSVWKSNYPATVRFPEISGGFTALHFVAQQGNVDSAKSLLDAGADINSPHQENGSPLLIAIASGHEQLALFLLENGADPNMKDGWGISPLHYAIHKGVLILNGHKSVKTDRFGWDRQNMPELVEALLDRGADPNAKIGFEFPYLDDPFLARGDSVPAITTPVGATPLLAAAASGDIELMQLLEEASDPTITTISGASLFMLAAGVGSERGVRKQEEAIKAARLALSLRGGNVNDRLIDRAPGGPAKGKEDGRTALHFAAYFGWTDMIRFLAENGANLNVEDRYGMTPLMIALGDPEGRYYRQVGDSNEDHRYRKTGAFPGNGANMEVADLLLELGAKPFTGKVRDTSGL
jgi:uncharacterized protein